MFVMFRRAVNSESILSSYCLRGMRVVGTDGANLIDDLSPSCFARDKYRMTVPSHGNASVQRRGSTTHAWCRADINLPRVFPQGFAPSVS